MSTMFGILDSEIHVAFNLAILNMSSHILLGLKLSGCFNQPEGGTEASRILTTATAT